MCGVTELDYSPQKIIQTEVDYAYNCVISPQNTLIKGNNILFHIEGGTDYVDLGNTELSVELTLTKSDGTKIPEAAKIAPVNNILHSLWSQIQVKLKDTTISHPSPNYAYRGYIENLLNYSENSKNTWMLNQGWIYDEASKFDAEANSGHIARHGYYKDKSVVQLRGRLSTDIGNQELLIPSRREFYFDPFITKIHTYAIR